MAWESFGVVGFNLGPLLQGQTRIAKLKSAYNLLIISPSGPQKVLGVGQPNFVCTFLREESRRQSILGSVGP